MMKLFLLFEQQGPAQYYQYLFIHITFCTMHKSSEPEIPCFKPGIVKRVERFETFRSMVRKIDNMFSRDVDNIEPFTSERGSPKSIR